MKDFLEKITKLGPCQIILLITIISIVLYSIDPYSLNVLELKAYDLRFRLRGPEKPGSEIVIVKIDEKSIRDTKLGRWPWSREHWAKLVERLTEWEAKVIGIDAIFAEKESTGADDKLADAIEKSGSVVVGYFFLTSEEEIKELEQASRKEEDADRVAPKTIPVFFPPDQRVKEIPLTQALFIRSNIDEISKNAKGLGFFNVKMDVKGNIDGTIRWVPLAMKFQDESSPSLVFWDNIYPSLALQVINEYLENPDSPFLRVADFVVKGIQVGDTFIPTGKEGGFLVNYRGGRNTFPGYSFSDVISDDPKEMRLAKHFRGKIVLVGATATGVYDARVTPFDPGLPGVEIHATVIDNILHRDFILQPDWIWAVNIPAIIVLALIPGLLIPRLSPLRGAPISLGLFVIYMVANWHFLVNQRLWINFVYPMLAFFGVFVAVTVYQYVTEEREKRKIRSAFQFFVSPGVVNEILRHPGKLRLGGERKVLTVLFSDLREFTHLSETLPPDTLTILLNLFLTPMTDIVFKYQGTLDKYMGDAIMAFFGAPLEQEDHAEKACRTALDMVEALKHLQKNWEIDGVPEISMGIGINTGPMSVGNMGSDVLFDYTVVGDHVNLGSRLEKLNREYGTSIIISEFTHSHLEDTFVCRELDIVRVRGRTEPVRIFELLGREEPFHQWPAFKMLFEKGLLAYRSQRWDEGIGAFEEALKIRPDDGPAKLHLRRCRLLRKRAPSPVWDGVYQMRD
jgi:adenylate cyclase